MDRASSDCRLLYEIIGPRGRARAIQTPSPATDSGSNRESENEKREARADIAAAARSHAYHTERVSTPLSTPLSGSAVVLPRRERGGEKGGKAGDGRSETPFRRRTMRAGYRDPDNRMFGRGIDSVIFSLGRKHGNVYY